MALLCLITIMTALLLAPTQCLVNVNTVSVASVKSQIIDALERKDTSALAGVLLLEAGFVPIQTREFFDMAVCGDWHLHYSDGPAMPDPHINIKICQTITPELTVLENRVEWTLVDTSAGGGELGDVMTGDLVIKSRYEVNSKGHMVCTDVDHTLLPENRVPADIDAFLAALQRTVPFEFFDPSETSIQTSYIDPDMRIARVKGRRFQRDILNIFLRRKQLS